MTRTTTITVSPVTRAVGAVIDGVDMREPLDEEMAGRLRQPWLDYGVVFFREQDITPEQLMGFFAHFGTPITEPSSAAYGADPNADLQFITPDGTLHDGRANFMAFHEESLERPKVWGVVHCYGPEIAVTGPDTAQGIWAMEDVHIWPGGDGPPIGHRGYGYYHEDYVRVEDGWRFNRIQVIYDRVEPLEGGFPPGIEH